MWLLGNSETLRQRCHNRTQRATNVNTASALPKDWQNWLQTSLQYGCARGKIHTVLRNEGFSDHLIQTEMHKLSAAPKSTIPAQPSQAEAAQQSQRKAQTDQNKQSQNKQNQEKKMNLPKRLQFSNAERVATPDVHMYIVPDFLNATECDAIIKHIRQYNTPSQVTTKNGDEGFRTSSTCHMGDLQDVLISEVDSRICSYLNIPAGYGEPIQGQYYQVGQVFKAHTDYFDVCDLPTFSEGQGQRTYTFMIYLNDVSSGGETTFPVIHQTFKPKQGLALIWDNLDAEGNPIYATLHESVAVKQGEKFIITKWFRETVYTPTDAT